MQIISIEGGEGSGKSTLVDSLYTYLIKNYVSGKKLNCIKTQEPTNSNPIGSLIRQIYLDKNNKMSPETELMLFMANRSYHIDSLIKNDFPVGSSIVLIDRYIDSSIVYQGILKNIDRQFIDDLNSFVTKNERYFPVLTLVLDIDPEISINRIKNRKNKEINDIQSYDFHKKVQLGFQQLALMYPNRVKLINANQTLAKVIQDSLDEIKKIII